MRAGILQHPFRRFLPWLGTAVIVGCSEDAGTDPGFTSLSILPVELSIAQGASSSLIATVTRSGGAALAVNLTVMGLPPGVHSFVSNEQTAGRVTTATITIKVDGTVTPGTYPLTVLSAGTGGNATAPLELAVTLLPAACPGPGLPCEQWALSAAASSEYTSAAWSALMATGPPDAVACADDGLAWASLEPDGVEWLELTYRESVRPTEINIHEVLTVSSIVKVEVREVAGTYHTVYTAEPEAMTCPRVLTIPIAGITAAVRVVRLTIDQSVFQYWTEIDAVKLTGIR